MSPAFLQTLGVQLELGREFTTADGIPGSERVVILSDSFWRARFGGDRSILGRQLRLDGNGYTVVGVLPPSFRFMDRQISLIAPLRFNRAEVPLIQFCCQGIARLKPGVTLAAADADVARMLPMAAAKFPMNPGLSRTLFEDARIAPRLQPLKDLLVGSVRGTLWVLMATVGILLAIACANVANLMLVRTDARQAGIGYARRPGCGGVAHRAGTAAGERLGKLCRRRARCRYCRGRGAVVHCLRRTAPAANGGDLDQSRGIGICRLYLAGHRIAVRSGPGLQICTPRGFHGTAERWAVTYRKQGEASCARHPRVRPGSTGAGSAGGLRSDDPYRTGPAPRRSRILRLRPVSRPFESPFRKRR